MIKKKIAKMPHLGMKLEHWEKPPEVAHGVEVELLFALREAISETSPVFQNCHICV